MLSKKYHKKSSSISSVDSGLGCSMKDKLKRNSKVKTDCNQQFLQASSSTIKAQSLKRGLMNSNEKNLEYMHKATPVKIECASDLEYTATSQFSPLAFSTQQVKNSKSTSESSDKKKKNSSSKFEEGLSNPNEITIDLNRISKSRTKSRKKLMINILENHLIHSDLKEEGDSDGYLSVQEVHEPISSYSVSSSEEENRKLQSENVIQRMKPVKVDETQHSLAEPKILHKATTFQNQLHFSENSMPSQEKCDISSSDSESSETLSTNERNSYVATQSKKKHKRPTKMDNISNIFNEGYEKLSVPRNADFGDLDSDDEVYLLEIPKTINPEILKGVSFSFLKKSKLKLGCEKYYIRPESNYSKFLTFTNNMKIIRPLATLKMVKHLKAEKTDEFVLEKTKRNPLPNGIKVRHPFFGCEYESKSRLEQQIKDRLEQADKGINLIQKISKNLEKREIGNGSTSKKKKKSAEIEIKMEISDHEGFESNGVSLKQNKEYNNEFKIKKEILNDEEFEFNEIPLKKKKKQKSLERRIEFPVEKELSDEHSPHSLRTKGKSILSSTRIHENFNMSSDFKFDVSKIDSEELSIEKSEHCDIENYNGNADLINSLLQSAKIKIENPGNKKKEKKCKRKSN